MKKEKSKQVNGINEIIGNENESLNRPAWTQYDWYAYNHRHTLKGVDKDYFIKSCGTL